MKRFILVLALAALMAVMFVAMAAPAFAISEKGTHKYCANAATHGAQGGPPGVACAIAS